MLSQKIFNVINFPKKKVFQALTTQSLTTSTPLLNQNGWFQEQSSNSSKIGTSGSEIEKKESDRESNLVKESDNLVFAILHSELELTPWGIKKYMNKNRIINKKEMQKFNKMRVDVLGSDLAVAHFLIYQGGKVKFRGSDKWVELNADKRTVNIPNIFDPKYVLTAIDASGIELYYEALENFNNITRVTHINFARSPYFDDWFMDKLSGMFPNLEYLDVSDCPRLSERGLEALYKNSKLKTLIVTNNYKSAAFELTCLMLEDVLRELKVKIITPEEKMKLIINTNIVS